eukprot:Amastigsp_a846926_24.p2 type:complete len:186 gc:universal Amastigsp_a846926_24:562-5(-)
MLKASPIFGRARTSNGLSRCAASTARRRPQTQCTCASRRCKPSRDRAAKRTACSNAACASARTPCRCCRRRSRRTWPSPRVHGRRSSRSSAAAWPLSAGSSTAPRASLRTLLETTARKRGLSCLKTARSQSMTRRPQSRSLSSTWTQRWSDGPSRAWPGREQACRWLPRPNKTEHCWAGDKEDPF